VKPDNGSESRFLPTPPFKGSRRNIAMPFGTEKPEWCGYPMVKKKFEDMFIRFVRMHERDGHTDRQTPHDDIGRACIASRGKKKTRIIYADKLIT